MQTHRDRSSDRAYGPVRPVSRGVLRSAVRVRSGGFAVHGPAAARRRSTCPRYPSAKCAPSPQPARGAFLAVSGCRAVSPCLHITRCRELPVPGLSATTSQWAVGNALCGVPRVTCGVPIDTCDDRIAIHETARMGGTAQRPFPTVFCLRPPGIDDFRVGPFFPIRDEFLSHGVVQGVVDDFNEGTLHV